MADERLIERTMENEDKNVKEYWTKKTQYIAHQNISGRGSETCCRLQILCICKCLCSYASASQFIWDTVTFLFVIQNLFRNP